MMRSMRSMRSTSTGTETTEAPSRMDNVEETVNGAAPNLAIRIRNTLDSTGGAA